MFRNVEEAKALSLIWDPAMSRVAAISGTRIRLLGQQEKQRAGNAEGGEKQGVRHWKQALPTPQGRSSGL